jgi:Predicted metal-dependent hydrolase
MSRYVEIGYPIYEGMPVYPGLPEVKLSLRERQDKGDYWNGSVLSIYLHAGTHVDAPWHYVPGAPTIDQIPIDRFIYQHPLMLDCPCEFQGLISTEQLKTAGPELAEADFLIFNTGYWRFRESDFTRYSTTFPALAPEAAEYIRADLPRCKAVAIDTLSIENIPQGIENGFRTHKAFLDPDRFSGPPILVYEDVNPEPIIGQRLKSAFTAPLRLVRHEASVVNIIVEIE